MNYYNEIKNKLIDNKVYKGNNTFGLNTLAATANGICFITFVLIDTFTLKLAGTISFHSGFSEIESIISSNIETC